MNEEVNEVLNFIKNKFAIGENLAIYLIRSKFTMGYTKCEKILEELKEQNYLSYEVKNGSVYWKRIS